MICPMCGASMNKQSKKRGDFVSHVCRKCGCELQEKRIPDGYGGAFANQEDLLRMRIDAAMDVATENGFIDGQHHKQWVIDQMLRALCDDDYDQLFGSDENWDKGTAP